MDRLAKAEVAGTHAKKSLEIFITWQIVDDLRRSPPIRIIGACSINSHAASDGDAALHAFTRR